MIKEIVTNIETLSIKSRPCYFTLESDIKENEETIQDMIDTANANEPHCIGLAANQISVLKRIILMKLDGEWTAMLNPTFIPVKTAGMKRFKEGCLSFPNRRHRPKMRRYKKVIAVYQTITGEKERLTMLKINAVIMQHEIDHLNGKPI